MRNIKKKILYLTFRLPFPPTSGEKIRSFYTLKFLSENNDITLISLVKSNNELIYIEEYNRYFKKIITIKLINISSFFNSFIGLFSRKPLQVSFFYSARMKKIINKELQNNYDVVFCHLIRMAQYVPDHVNIRKIIDLTDAISLNFKRSLKYRKGIWKLIYKIENKRIFSY